MPFFEVCRCKAETLRSVMFNNLRGRTDVYLVNCGSANMIRKLRKQGFSEMTSNKGDGSKLKRVFFWIINL